MVLIGVLLALFLDSCREDIEFQKLVNVTEAQVVEEVQGNRERLNSYLQDFESRKIRLSEWGSGLNSEKGILSQLENFPGIPSTFINRSAWSMANNSQITEHIDHKFYDAAFQLYADAEGIESRLGVAVEVFFDVKGFDGDYTMPIYQLLRLYFEDIIGNLKSLIRDHDEFLDRFGKQAN